VRGAARDVEHDHRVVQWLDPRQGPCWAVRERGVGTGEQAELTFERTAHDVVVVTLHRRILPGASACAQVTGLYGVAPTIEYVEVAQIVDNSGS